MSPRPYLPRDLCNSSKSDTYDIGCNILKAGGLCQQVQSQLTIEATHLLESGRPVSWAGEEGRGEEGRGEEEEEERSGGNRRVHKNSNMNQTNTQQTQSGKNTSHASTKHIFRLSKISLASAGKQ